MGSRCFQMWRTRLKLELRCAGKVNDHSLHGQYGQCHGRVSELHGFDLLKSVI